MARTCDVKSYELAQHFITEYAPRLGWREVDNLTMKLACEIQQAVEDWCRELDAKLEHEPFPENYST